MSAAVIAGSFADYRLVKSRGCLQLVIEVPVEQQGAAFAALGYPLPGTEIAVAVARLNPPAGNPQPPGKEASPAPQEPAGGIHKAKERYAAMSPAEQAVTRAAILCQDARFREWMTRRYFPRVAALGTFASEDEVADWFRDVCCDGGSRKRIGEVPEYMDRFIQIETEFKIDVGELARPR